MYNIHYIKDIEHVKRATGIPVPEYNISGSSLKGPFVILGQENEIKDTILNTLKAMYCVIYYIFFAL